MKSIKKQQIIAFLTCIIFLFTSCPMPEDNPPKKEDTGKVFKCYIDEEGNPTEQEEESAGKMYWVEKDGKVQPGTATLLRKDNIINVVNISDPETQKTYRMYFMDGANLPYRLIVEGEGITVVGSNIRYDEKAETLSLLLTDKNTEESEELSGIRLNSDLFNLKVHNQYENYYVTMAACFVYAIDYYEDNYINSSENVTRGWKSFLNRLVFGRSNSIFCSSSCSIANGSSNRKCNSSKCNNGKCRVGCGRYDQCRSCCSNAKYTRRRL